MNAVTFSDEEVRFLQFVRVGRLATRRDADIHVVPMCPVYEDGVFYMGSAARTRKVSNLRRDPGATLLLDQYSEDWLRNVGIMVVGAAEIVARGPEFERGKALLEAKFQQYRSLFPMREGESVVIRFRPISSVTWDYASGELNEPH